MRDDQFWRWFDEHARPRLAGRADTFARIFAHLDALDRPVSIVETGCLSGDPTGDDAWRKDGCSTILFDRYARARPGSRVHSVDINAETVAAARQHVSGATDIVALDSVRFLQAMAATTAGLAIDLLYLDSCDFTPSDPLPSAIHHHAELMAAMPMIRPDTLVVVDSPATFDEHRRLEIGGAGFLIAKHMALAGGDLAFCSHQTGWTNVGPVRQRSEDDLTIILQRARAHLSAGRVVAAEQLCRLILGLTPMPRRGTARLAHAEACGFYALLAVSQEKLGVAIDWFNEALLANPLATDYRIQLITKCLLPMGIFDGALAEAERATRIAPHDSAAWRVLADVHYKMNNTAQGLEAYKRQLELHPNNLDELLARARIALDLADFPTVRSLCTKVLEIEQKPDALHLSALLAFREHRHEDAVELYDKAISAGCRDAPNAHWNKSMALHAIGRWREAWVEQEYRYQQKLVLGVRMVVKRFERPLWCGEAAVKPDGSPAVIHVHTEAGAGDNLCLARYLRVLRDGGYCVRYETTDQMVDLMRTSFPDVEVMPKAPDYPGALGINPFDYHIPIMGLPGVFKPDIDSVPWSGPYLKADPMLAARFQTSLSGQDRRRVGFCWASRIFGITSELWQREFGRRKSMTFDDLMPVLRFQDQNLFAVSLQVGPQRQQHGGRIADVLPEHPTWAETAALIANLDLVVTVDTGVAHLAGGMGKPVWLMCQRDDPSCFFMCWRPGAPWNERTPWYPSMRIFRQREFDRPHFWGDVVAEIAEELGRWQREPDVAVAANVVP